MSDALEPLTIKARKNFLDLLQETNGPGADGHSYRTATICHPRALVALGRILRHRNANSKSTATTAPGR